MSVKTINISLDAELLVKIDKAAKSEYASRSDYIRQSVVGKLRQDARDEWGDRAAEWAPGVDLRDKTGKGISAKQLLKEVKTTQTKKSR